MSDQHLIDFLLKAIEPFDKENVFLAPKDIIELINNYLQITRKNQSNVN
jgi:hypothetical protein